MPDTWRDVAARKQEERAKRIPREWLLSSTSPEKYNGNVLSIPRECGLLSDEELSITEGCDASELVAKLVAGKVNAVDVTTAFCKRAAIAQQLTNCLSEIFFEEGIARAKHLDDQFAKTEKPVGPLHGLPISLKDSFKVKGYDASIGAAALCFNPATANSALVDLLLEQGAVLYCKTNIPLTLAALDSHNNIFGRTLNPANRSLTAGGSSGGEGALVAMRGSPLGVGTDVGGSIRIPAMCNGLVGVKPSHGRVPYAGQEAGSAPGSSKLGIEATAGPIARTMRDCELFMRVVGDASPWLFDPDVVPHTWKQQTSLKTRTLSSQTSQPLRVGIMRTEGHSTPLPPIQQIMDEVVSQLKSPALPSWHAIEVVDIDVSALGPKCLKTFNGVMSIDGANYWFDLLAETGEPLSPWLQSRLRRRDPKTLNQVRDLKAQISQLQTEALKVWKEDGGYWQTPESKAGKGNRTLDVIICPVAPHPVAPIDRWNTTNYTSMFNLLDLPAGVLPIRPFRKPDLDGELPQTQPLNGWDKINRELWTNVDRSVYMDSALSVQIVAPKLMDRKLVETMAVLEKALAPLAMSRSQGSKL